MIDLAGIVAPADAPEAGACIRIERPEDGLVRLVLDPPHRTKIAVFDVPLLTDLDRAIDELAGDASVRGLVVTGREPLSFAAGADVESIAQITDPAVAKRFAHEGQQLFHRLFRLGRRGGGRVLTVAAVGGPVPGGACELALACDRIVLAEDDKTRIGLPEVLLGILPAWGGSQRLPRRVGIPAALDSILNGRLQPAKKALRLGMVDRLTKPELLLKVASDVATGRERLPFRGRAGLRKVLVDKNPLFARIAANKARQTVLSKTHGHYPAPLAVLQLIADAPRTPIDQGLRKEVEAIAPLAGSPVSQSLVGLFLLQERAKKLPGSGEEGAVAFERAAVVGAGVMGGAIASLMAEKGLAVRLRDLDRGQLDAAEREHRRAIDKKRKRRRLALHRANRAIDRLETTTEGVGFARCDFAIEAVAERLDVKRVVLSELAAAMPDGAVLATNTSSLSVDAIAAELPGPERVVGMHFFNPVRRMPLVEIVRGARTSDEVIRRTARLAVHLGKIPVVTRDVAGFLVNRVLGPYLDETVRLVSRGADPETIDAALVGFGMPMGPCELLDEVGLDIAAHAGASLQEAYGERMQTCDFLRPLVEAGQLGKKTEAGIYRWRASKGGRLTKDGVNPRTKGAGGESLPETAIVDRLVLAMVNEAVRALEEEVVEDAALLDLATVMGTGFAPFRGGVLRYADTRGLSGIVERLRALADEAAPDGERRGRFEPAPLLVQHANEGRKLRD